MGDLHGHQFYSAHCDAIFQDGPAVVEWSDLLLGRVRNLFLLDRIDGCLPAAARVSINDVGGATVVGALFLSAHLEHRSFPRPRGQIDLALATESATIAHLHKVLRAPSMFANTLIGSLPDGGKSVAVVQICSSTRAISPALRAANVSRGRETAPKPVPVPSQFTWFRTLPAGPGVWVEVMALNENSPTAFPDAMALPP